MGEINLTGICVVTFLYWINTIFVANPKSSDTRISHKFCARRAVWR